MNKVTTKLNFMVCNLKPVRIKPIFHEISNLAYDIEQLLITMRYNSTDSNNWINIPHYPSDFLIQSLNK